jgi:hypothetical protein
MAILCRSHRLLFILAPRTGSSAVAKALSEHLEGENIPDQHILDDQGKFLASKKHTTLTQLHRYGLISPDQRRQLFAFTCVRNPFDSLVSFYIKKAVTYQHFLAKPDSFVYRIPGYAEDMRWARDHTFDEWIVRKFAPRLLDRLLGRRRGGPASLFSHYTDGTNAIMRFESLQADLDRVLEQAGVKQRVIVPNFNVTPERERDYRRYYSKRTRRIVEVRFAEDLHRYGYHF